MRSYYLSAGNFPSIAANTIQIAKMACAYARWLPGIRMVALAGEKALFEGEPPDIAELYGLRRPVEVDYLPLLPERGYGLYEHDYRPPKWFYSLAAQYAAWHKADLVMTRKPETALAAIALGVPTILENHVPFEYFPHLKERLEYFSSPLLKAVVVVSEGLAEEHVRAGLPEDRIIFEHDGVDLSQYSLVGDRRALRRELGWDDRPRVVYTGHLFEERAIDVAIKAAAAAEDVEFVFVGGWPEDLARCEKLAAGLANVVFTGFVEHAKVARYQAAADVLLMQYSLDAHHADRCSPLKLFEYMASGRPMIATDMPTLEGLLNHGENCLLVPPGSSGALAAAVKKLVKEPLLGEKLAEQARLDVEYYDWDLRAKRILDAALKDVG